MFVKEHNDGDRQKLKSLAKSAKKVSQRDRYLSVYHALGGMETLDIAAALCRSRRFVQTWVYIYRNSGIDAIVVKSPPGRPPNLNDKQAVAKLVQRIEAGVTNNDKVCTLRGKDLQRIIQEELGVKQSISSVYRTLHRLGYSCLAPRPRHEKQDSRRPD